MKKLMLTTAVVALAGVASAAKVGNYGNIFDYKASVKYVDFKKISAKDDLGYSSSILVKTVKSATLTGYLVTPQCCPCQYADPGVNGPCERFGMAPSFLVLQNKASKKYNDYYDLSTVKIMPANLLTEWWTTKAAFRGTKDVELQAQGYLFSGVGKRDVPDPKGSPFYGLGDRGIVPSTDVYKLRTAATQFLFGYYNVVDKADPSEPVADFIEPFLDHAGFGKAKYFWTKGGRTSAPCYVKDDPNVGEICLQSLSGTLIGGNFDCALNGSYAVKPAKSGFPYSAGAAAWADAEDYICQGWDDHTENAKSWGSVNYNNQMEQVFQNAYMYNVVCGTWSIKVNTKIANGATELNDVINCAVKIDKNFNIRTFDTPNSIFLTGLEDNFYLKWFSKLP